MLMFLKLRPLTACYGASCKVCINLPACHYDLDVHKAWLFKSTLEALASMGGVCNHPQGFHKSIVGTRDEHGNFQSKQTAQYPKVLAETFAKIVGPLISGPSGILTLQDAMHCLPRKQLSEPPQAYQDGGGLFSFPDWSYPRTDQSDPFKELPAILFSFCFCKTAITRDCYVIFTWGTQTPHFLTKNWSHFNNVWCVGCKSAT